MVHLISLSDVSYFHLISIKIRIFYPSICTIGKIYKLAFTRFGKNRILHLSEKYVVLWYDYNYSILK